eukprot:3847068-Pyramimonas_sp.AAC.2
MKHAPLSRFFPERCVPVTLQGPASGGAYRMRVRMERSVRSAQGGNAHLQAPRSNGCAYCGPEIATDCAVVSVGCLPAYANLRPRLRNPLRNPPLRV